MSDDSSQSAQSLPSAGQGGAQAERLAPRLLVAWMILIVACVLATYGRSISFDFLESWDDDIHVTANPHLLPRSAEGMAWFWTHPYRGLYVPASYTFWMLEAAAAGGSSGRPESLDARVFRLGSLGLHAAAAVLVFVLLCTVLERGRAAAAGALLFALHPLQVEAVAWISETRGLLAAVLGLGALCLHARESSMPRKFLALILLALALLSKPSAMCVPLIALVLDVVLLRRTARSSLAALAPWFLLACAAGLLAKRLQPDTSVAQLASWWQRPWIAADALAFYASKLLLPTGLSPDLGRTPERVLAAGLAAMHLALGLFLAAFVLRERARRFARASALVFVSALAPVLGLIPFEHQEISTVASRFAYLAMLGPALALGCLTERVGRRGWGCVALGMLLIACAVTSFRATGSWSDLRVLFERNLEVQPESARAHLLVGLALERERDFEGAAAHYRDALRLEPGKPNAHLNLGNALLHLGRTEDGLAEYDLALASRPDYRLARENLSHALMRLGRWSRAVPHLKELVAASPIDAALRGSLARALWLAKEPEAAVGELERARALAPQDSVLALDLAWLLATSSEKAVRDPTRALELAAANSLLPQHLEIRRLWIEAAARAALGDRERAIAAAQDACVRATAAGQPELQARLRDWITRVEAGELPGDLPPLSVALSLEPAGPGPVPAGSRP